MIHVSDDACLDRYALHKNSGSILTARSIFEEEGRKGLLGAGRLIYVVNDNFYA